MIALLVILISGLGGMIYAITHDFTEDFKRCKDCNNVLSNGKCIVCKKKK